MFSFLFLLVIFFFMHILSKQSHYFMLFRLKWEKKERIKVLCRKREKFKQLSMCCEAKLFRVLFFLFVRLFLTFFWSILIHGCRLATEKKRLDDVQKIWHKYDKTKQSRSEHTLAKKCWNKQKTIFFFCKNCWPIPSLFAPWAKFLW